MILFLDDWKKYPRAIVDTKTKNTSYIRVAKILKEMGVKHYFFHLSLLQPELQGVDPFSKDLTPLQMAMIKYEIIKNPWYFFREILRIPPASGDEPMFLTLNRGILAAWWCYLNHQAYNLTLPRQAGKSTSTNGLLVWLLFFVYRNTKIFMLTKDDTLRTENIDAIKKIQALLPDWLNPQSKQDLNNTEKITCRKYQNVLLTAVPRGSEIDANKIGRGHTCATYVTDEPPFCNYIEKSLRSMLAGGLKAMPVAEANGMPYGTIYTTTAGSKADRDGSYYYKMIMGGVFWDESFYDFKDGNELRETIRKNKKGVQPIVNITLSHTQIGLTDEWLIGAMELTGSTGDDANRDFFNVWTDGSNTSPLSKQLSKLIRDSSEEPQYVQVTEQGYLVNWYVPRDRLESTMTSGQFVIGLDTSEAIGRDGIAMVMLDSSSLETICTLGVNETNILKFTEWLTSFMLKYEKTVLIPERKSTGTTVVSGLLIAFTKYNLNPFKRIFNTLVQKDEHDTRDGRALISSVKNNPSVADKSIKYFGFATAGNGEYSRDGLYSTTLTKAASYSGPILKDRETIEELLSLSKKNNRIDHSVNGHDDRVVAWLLAIWLLTSGRNIDYYGITNPLSSAVSHEARLAIGNSSDVVLTADQLSKRHEEQNMIKANIEMLLDMISEEKDEVITLKLEDKLKRLDQRLIKTNEDVISINELIRKAREQRRNKHRGR